MPAALQRACRQPGCPAIQETDWCEAHQPKRERGRFNAAVRRWYQTARWANLRVLVLREEPYCKDCEAARRPVADSTDVDHIIPHRGNPKLFWNRRNLQGLCHPCHSRKTQRGE